ncbi:hypothetical protein Bpfe_029804 [Biomphalaria pfeifferi]|uniref:Uncharacterized protein n=1 Tax=Biomphalaria pfeifferi TaxID=112525 RepID=A0AAD8EUE4_BIOPF|nr:hypothetical protein Bpfe_029804 [Biomphalaria pfeifferi]
MNFSTFMMINHACCHMGLQRCWCKLLKLHIKYTSRNTHCEHVRLLGLMINALNRHLGASGQLHKEINMLRFFTFPNTYREGLA